MLQILIPALLGAHQAKKKGGSVLKGALLGGLLGSFIPGGGTTSAATTTSGTKLASSKGLKGALSTAKSGSVPIVEKSITTAGKQVASKLPSAKAQVASFNKGLLNNQAQVLDAVQKSGGQLSLSPESIAQLNTKPVLNYSPVGGGQGVNATQQALNTYNQNVANSVLNPNATPLKASTLDKTLVDSAKSLQASEGTMAQRISDKVKSTVKEKPVETAMAASALFGEQGGGAVVGGGGAPTLTQPGGFGDVPSVEESIAGQVNEPTFIPRGLFEETKNTMKSREEEMMMMQYLNSRGLV
tara:strand:+ start:13333 stop:14229 length:897 start_codon:yes stop_codon:yes gene_type:complete